MLNNIFGRTPEAIPVAAPVATSAPIVAEKKSFTEKVKSFFSSYEPITLAPKHQDNIRQMMKRLPSVNSTLASDVFESIKNEDIQQILHYYKDLNTLTVDNAKASPTYTKFYALLGKSVVARLLSLGSGINASLHGGKAHAELALKNQLLLGMKEGVNNAMQGKGLTDQDKQIFLDAFTKQIEAKLTDGSASPEEVIEEIRKMTSDSVIGADAQAGSVGKKLAKLSAKAEQKIKDTEKATVLEAIDGHYQVQNEKLNLINELLTKVEALQNNPDASVEESAIVTQEIQTISNQIVELVKELDDTSKISSAHLRNPLSRNIKGPRETELDSLLTHDLQKAELNLKVQAQEINVELITKLQAIQNGRPLSQKLWDGIFNRSSKENAILSTSAKTQGRIASLNKSISSFEAVEAAKVATVSSRSWAQFGSDLLARVNPFKGSTPSPQDQYDAAIVALDAFNADETVQSVLSGYDKLLIAADTANKKFFLFSSSKQKAVDAIRDEIGTYVTTNLPVFEQHQLLTQNKNAAEIAVAELIQQEEIVAG